jgi:hypothetical protein
MSTLSGGPNIVVDGLVLYLDAANRYSYVSGSTTWRDLSRSNNNGTLVNGPTFNSANGGSIVFDGTNDYVADSTITPFVTGSMSYEIVFKSNSNAGVQPLGSSDIVSTIPYFFLNYNGVAIQTYHFGSSPQYFTVQTLSTGTIGHFICIRNGLNELNYFNGLPTTGRTLNNSLGNNNGLTGIGGYPGVYLNGNIYTIRTYNRALSAQEVLQNYNATKTRFGL